jgi:hypothetical protein
LCPLLSVPSNLQEKTIFPVGMKDPSCHDLDARLASVRTQVRPPNTITLHPSQRLYHIYLAVPVALGRPKCLPFSTLRRRKSTQIVSLTEEAMKGPLGLAERYGAYVHLAAINTDEFVDDFEASDPNAFRDVTDDPFLARFLKYRAKVGVSCE